MKRSTASRRAREVNPYGSEVDGAPGGSSGRFGGFSSELEAVLANRMAIAGLPHAETQFRFCSTRRWRSDFAYPSAMLLIEVDGGTWSGGRHVRGKGFEADCEKMGAAAAMGFRVLRVTRSMIESGVAVKLIHDCLHGIDCECPISKCYNLGI